MDPQDQLHSIAKRRVEARTGFFVHLVMYVIANLGFVIIWALTGQGYPWFVWPLLIWGVAVASHAVTLIIGPGSPREQRAIEREMRRMHSTEQH
jgi:hypothetical protein